ncbi:hypothetical protein [Gemmatimonas sp.]|jgi:hypothetical protein|uniref:hypothetical protein n=1 Tax=Gemmatimonas sp. TaxID=1962908 RepID=UPI0037C0049D
MKVDTQVDMQPSNAHLDLERLAAFDALPFNAEELAHLASCAACRAERDAVASVVSLASAWGQSAPNAEVPRLVEWEQIAAGLRGDVSASTVTTPADRVTPARATAAPRRAFAPFLRRAAAALMLISGGAVAGRLSGGLSSADTAAIAAALGAEPSATLTDVASGIGARAVAFGNEPDFRTVDEATGVLFRAQRDYERASLWLASNDTTVRDSEVYRTRLAALDQMMAASRAALRDAPQDPVLNHYYLAAYTAREATLQALGGALPVDKIIERY